MEERETKISRLKVNHFWGEYVKSDNNFGSEKVTRSGPAVEVVRGGQQRKQVLAQHPSQTDSLYTNSSPKYKPFSPFTKFLWTEYTQTDCTNLQL